MRSTLRFKKTESGGVETAMTARDAVDSLIDELAGYAKIEAEEDSTGYVRIKLEGQQFVQDNKCNHIGPDRGKGYRLFIHRTGPYYYTGELYAGV